MPDHEGLDPIQNALAIAFMDGQIFERERIIKLLEAETEKLFKQGAGVGALVTKHLVALIKGEAE